MQKFIGELVGTSVVTKKERLLLGFLTEVVIQPETGKIAGYVFKADSAKAIFCVNATDVVGYGSDFILIESVEMVAPPEEIIRIKEVLDQGIKLIGSLVVDDTETELGKIIDYTLDLSAGKLARIYVKPKGSILSFATDMIIHEKNILKIEKGKVTVRSALEKEKRVAPSKKIQTKIPRTELA